MPYTHYITKPTTITKYKGSTPFRLAADYSYNKNVDLSLPAGHASGIWNTFVENDLVLLTAQTNTTENGLYIMNGGKLQKYYGNFFASIDKIYTIEHKDGISSYLGFFGVNNTLNQLKSIAPGQGVIIVCKSDTQLPLTWYTYNDDQLPSLTIHRSITKGNIKNLGIISSEDEGSGHTIAPLTISLDYQAYKPIVITSQISQSSTSTNYFIKTDLVSCPDPEYVDVSARIDLSKTDFAVGLDGDINLDGVIDFDDVLLTVSQGLVSGGLLKFRLSLGAISSKFANIKENSIVWITNSDYSINDLYTYDGYSLLTKLHNSDYLLQNKKYVIEEPSIGITSLQDSFYMNHVFYVGYPGHYDIFFSLVDSTTGAIVSTDNYCFDIEDTKLMPTPTPTLTPTPTVHKVEFEDGKYLSIPECESCIKRYLPVVAESLLANGNYFYEFGVFDKGVHSPRDLDNASGESFEPQSGFLSTGPTSQKFGTYFTTEYKVRTTIYVKLTNLNTNISATSYLTIAVCDENYCPPNPTPTPTPTNPRFNYPKRTPTLTASPAP